MGPLLVLLALAGPARATPALEAGLGLTLPYGGLGVGPGLYAATDFALGERFAVGPAAILRLPSAARGTLDDDAVSGEPEWKTGLTAMAAAARGQVLVGPRDRVHGRVGADLGLAFLGLHTEAPAGSTSEAALAPWLALRGGPLIPAGPGQVALGLALHVAPAELVVLGGSTGGSGLTVEAGYRFVLP